MLSCNYGVLVEDNGRTVYTFTTLPARAEFCVLSGNAPFHASLGMVNINFLKNISGSDTRVAINISSLNNINDITKISNQTSGNGDYWQTNTLDQSKWLVRDSGGDLSQLTGFNTSGPIKIDYNISGDYQLSTIVNNNAYTDGTSAMYAWLNH